MTSPFRSPLHLAEVASAGVRYNLAIGDRLAASALQPVARAAWTLVEDAASSHELLVAARAADHRLRMAVGMTGERQFLRDVLDYLREDANADAPSPHAPRRRPDHRYRRVKSPSGTRWVRS